MFIRIKMSCQSPKYLLKEARATNGSGKALERKISSPALNATLQSLLLCLAKDALPLLGPKNPTHPITVPKF